MTSDERKILRFLVRGRVQRVGFRAFAARNARSLRLRGGAANLDNGRVVIVVEGPEYALDRFESALWSGTLAARVDGIEIAPAASVEAEGPFDVEF